MSNRILVAVGVVLSMMLLAPAAQAEQPAPPLPIVVTPSVVSDGTPFTVSGSGCVDPNLALGAGLQVYVVIERFGYVSPDDLSARLAVVAPVEADGSWSVETAPNTREKWYGPFEDFDSSVQAYCARGAFDDRVFAYEPVPIRYLGAGVDATTSTTTSVTPTVPALPTSGSAPQPAGAVAADPTFTG